MRIYIGSTTAEGCEVKVKNIQHGRWRFTALKPRLDVVNHSPAGFAWGYGGSGPAQLALALLLDAGLRPRQTEALHQQFKWDVIIHLNQDLGWEMTDRDVLLWVESQPREDAA